MSVALFIVSLVLAVIFLASGAAKCLMAKDRMIASGQTGVAPFPLPVIRVVAVAEILAAVGLVAPVALDVAPGLTVGAAAGLMVVMTGAAASHAHLREYPQVAVNGALFLAAGFVAVGRL